MQILKITCTALGFSLTSLQEKFRVMRNTIKNTSLNNKNVGKDAIAY